MKKTIAASLIAISTLLSAAPALAGVHSDYRDSARVVSATPIYETVEVYRPVEECWTERRIRGGGYRHDRGGATFVGGLIGGIIGNQFGHGDGRAAATVAGTLLGAGIGHSVSEPVHVRHRVSHERVCDVVERRETEEQLVGYRVKYRYKGQTFVTRTAEHPGRRISVRVAVEPLYDY